MNKACSIGKLAWIVAFEVALIQPCFGQEPKAADREPEAAIGESVAAEPAPATASADELPPLDLGQASEGAAAGSEAGTGPTEPTIGGGTQTPVSSIAEADTRAEAQSTSTDASSKSSPHSRVFEDIIVTAQKREENLSDVPVTVQAFSAEALDARGINSTMDLMKATPGLDFGVQAGDFASVFLRGIGSEAWLTSDPSVASYADGVYYSFTPSLIQDLGGIERVEVLKGPQGTLFGRNAIAGAINVITKEPDFQDRSVTIDQYVGSYQGRTGQDDDFAISKTTIFANVPLTETVAMNVASFFEYDKQQWDNDSTVGGEPVPAKKTFSARMKLRWQPTESFELRSTFWGSKREGTATLAANIRPTPFGTLLQNVDGGDEQHRNVNPGLPIYGHLQSTVGILSPIYYHDWFDTKLIYSHQVHSNPYNYDYDGVESAFASFIVHKHYAKIDEAELQFSSNDTSWASDWLTWTTGAFYFRNTQGFDPVEVTVGGINPQALEASGINLPTEFLTDLGGQTLSLLANDGQTPSYALSNIGLLRTESWSVYAQTTMQFTDWFALTLGGRYQDERRGVLESKTDLRIGTGAVTAFPWANARDARDNPITGPNLPFTATTSGFTPKVTLDFRPFDDDTLIFLTYQKAVKAHSYNAFAFYFRPAFVPEEKIEAYEIGFKGSLFDGAMRYSTGIFHYEIQNLQTQFISLLNGGALSLDVAGDARSIGVDFDITTFVFPSTFDSLVLTLNGAFIDAEYTEYLNGDGQNPDTGLFTTGNDYTGNRVTRTPDFSGSAALSNTWQIPGGPLEVSVNAYYNTGFFYVASEDPRYEQDAYLLAGAKVSYLFERSRLRTTLSVENLTDEFYTAGTLILDPGMLATLGQPRTVGIKFQYSF